MSVQVVPDSKFTSVRHNSALLIQNFEEISKFLLGEYERSNCNEAAVILNDLHEQMLGIIQATKKRVAERSSAEKTGCSDGAKLSRSAKKNSKRKNKNKFTEAAHTPSSPALFPERLSAGGRKELNEGLATLSVQIDTLGNKIRSWAAHRAAEAEQLEMMNQQLEQREDLGLLTCVLMHLRDAVRNVIITRCATSPTAKYNEEFEMLAGFLYKIECHPTRQDVLSEALLSIGMSPDELRTINSINFTSSWSVLHRSPKELLEELIRTGIGEEKFEEAKKVAIKFRALYDTAPAYGSF